MIRDLNGYEELLLKLEKEHIQVQLQVLPHTYVHWKMFKLAFQYKVWNEFFSQIPRLILAIPGSISGKAPRGNVGSSKMGIFEERK